MSGLTSDQNFWCSRVFLAVLRVFRGIMGCSGVLWDVPGVFRGCSGLFRAVPVVFRGVPGVFRGVPGCSGCVPGFTDTPLKQKLFSHFENHVLAVVVAGDQLQRKWRFDFRSLLCHAMTCHSRGGSVTD